MKSKLLLYIGAATCLAAIGAAAVQNLDIITLAKVFRGTPGNYTLVLDNSNTPSGLPSSYQNNFSGTVTTSNGNSINMSFVNAKSLDGGFAQLANHGRIYNFGSSNNQITSVNGIKFTGSGSLLFKPAVSADGSGAILADMTPITISAGSSKISVPVCDYFELEAGDSGASLISLELSYTCDETAYDVRLLNGTYTGVGNDNYSYKLTITDGSVSFASLDKQSNVSYSGTAELLSRTNVRLSLSSNSITYNLSYNGHNLTFSSKTGTIAEVSFTRVYNVQNYQLFSASGQGYTNSTTKYQTTNLRSSIYADYKSGSSSGEIAGSGWPVMTSSDNITYTSNKGHDGSKAAAFKFSNGTEMRYISINQLYGVNSIIGKGETLSFWARGAYSNSSLSTNHSSNIPLKMYAYYDTPANPSNQTSIHDTFEFTVLSGNNWQHFEMPLNSSKTYYGFGIYGKQTSGTTAYVPFDDFEIYSTSSYASAVTGITLDVNSLQVTAGETGYLTATVLPNEATNKGVTWTSANTSIATVDSDGVVTGVSSGSTTVTATTIDGGFTASCSITVVGGTYPEGTYECQVTMNNNPINFVISIGNQSNGLVAVRVANEKVTTSGITYNSNNKSISISASGSVSFEGGGSYSVTGISGTFDPNNSRLTNVSASGRLGNVVSNVTMNRVNTNLFNCDGTTQQLQSHFNRRYQQSNWFDDTSNADRITSNTTQFVSGSSSMKLRGYTGGPCAFNLMHDLTSPISIKNIQFWVYNPSSSDITLRIWMYKGQGLADGQEIGHVTASANGWSYVTMGFVAPGTTSDPISVYNFQIADFGKSGTYLSFDNIYLL